jgi:hypothetical protein
MLQRDLPIVPEFNPAKVGEVWKVSCQEFAQVLGLSFKFFIGT